MDGPTTAVTVLMSVHNGGQYIRTAIDSVLAQTYRIFHFLIVDDGSSDETPHIVRSYRDPRIELVVLEHNVGQTAALNVGLHRVRSPWVARMDADDYAAPTRFEEQMRVVEADPLLSCVGTFAWVFRDDPSVVESVIEKPLEDAAIKRQLWRIVPMIHGSLIMRRSTLLEVGGYDERYRYSADLDLFNRVLPQCRAVNLPRPLLGIRRHPNQGSYSRGTADENIEIFSRILATQCRTRREWATARSSLSYTYCVRARWGMANGGSCGEMIADLGRAVRWSPMTAVRQLAAPLVPARLRSSIRRWRAADLHHQRG